MPQPDPPVRPRSTRRPHRDRAGLHRVTGAQQLLPIDGRGLRRQAHDAVDAAHGLANLLTPSRASRQSIWSSNGRPPSPIRRRHRGRPAADRLGRGDETGCFSGSYPAASVVSPQGLACGGDRHGLADPSRHPDLHPGLSLRRPDPVGARSLPGAGPSAVTTMHVFTTSVNGPGGLRRAPRPRRSSWTACRCWYFRSPAAAPALPLPGHEPQRWTRKVGSLRPRYTFTRSIQLADRRRPLAPHDATTCPTYWRHAACWCRT